MAYKSILVQLDNMPDNLQRLHYALQLSQWFNATLSGLYVEPPSVLPAITDYDMDTALNDLNTEQESQQILQKTIQQQFKDCLQDYPCTGRFIKGHGELRQQLSYYARYHDLTIIDNHASDTLLDHYSTLATNVATDSGKPVIALPLQQPLSTNIERSLIAWNDSRESSRAVHDALPLLNRCKDVSIFPQAADHTIVENNNKDADRLRHYLANHDIHANIINNDQSNDAEQLIKHAEQKQHNLIIMGAYGHSRLRELLLGSTCRYILDNATVPVLLSH